MTRLARLCAAAFLATGVVACGGGEGNGGSDGSSQRAAQPLPASADRPAALIAGERYETATFEPQASFTLPAGKWETAAPESPTSLGIRLLAPPPTENAILSLVRPAKVFDPQRGGRSAKDTEDPPPDFVEWLADHPRLRATPPKLAEVGGLEGRQLDVTVASAPARVPPECSRGPCLPLYVDAPGGEPVGFAVGDRFRYVVLDGPSGQVLAELYVSPASRFKAVVPRLERALARFRFSGS